MGGEPGIMVDVVVCVYRLVVDFAYALATVL